MRARATRWRSRSTWATATRSTCPSPTSPPVTPTRTTRTSATSSRRCDPGDSKRSRGCEPGRGEVSTVPPSPAGYRTSRARKSVGADGVRDGLGESTGAGEPGSADPMQCGDRGRPLQPQLGGQQLPQQRMDLVAAGGRGRVLGEGTGARQSGKEPVGEVTGEAGDQLRPQLVGHADPQEPPARFG